MTRNTKRMFAFPENFALLSFHVSNSTPNHVGSSRNAFANNELITH
jgi:hypothetical protein